MEWDKKEEIEMEMLLQEISCGHFHGYDDASLSDGSSSSSSRSLSPSGDDTSVTTTLSSPDSSRRFSSSDDVALKNALTAVWVSDEPKPDSEIDFFEHSLFQAEKGANLTESWVNAHQFDASIPRKNNSHFSASVSDYSSFNSDHNANQFAQISRENNDIPVSVGYYSSSKLQGFKSKKLNERLIAVEGYMYLFAKDQNGCRFLQKKLEEGKKFIDLIFNGVINHITELSVNPFGNYLMQKIIQLCDEDQRKRIIVFLTQDPSVLVRVSLNIHGTRTVQKLVETIKTKEERSLVLSALQAGFLEIVKDLNGNHVIQRCLQTFDVEGNQVIFDACIAHCVEISTHRHGCCVMQRCIANSSDEQREKLVDAICSYGLDLAQDSFGNYVVQYLLEVKNSSAFAKLAYQFEGRYARLSMLKFSSNVVEKCLKVFTEPEKAKIVRELLAVPRFKLMLQHPFSNYVIQAALRNTKGSLHAALVGAIQPYASALRTNTYCKRIFRRALLKK